MCISTITWTHVTTQSRLFVEVARKEGDNATENEGKEGELLNPDGRELGSTNQNAIAKTKYPVGLCHTIPGAKLCSVPCISVFLCNG